MTDLTGKKALITGASRGIGRAAALRLAALGADIIATAKPRSQGQLEDLDDEIRALGRSVTIAPIDLRDMDAIDRLGAALFERFGKLDILIGNAAILGPISPLDHVTPKDWQEVMDVNVTANWRLIRSLYPLLKLADGGKAVFLTSGAAGKHKAYWGPYAASKAALEEMVRTFAAEARSTGVRANLLDPGATATSMRAAAVPGEDPSTLPSPQDVAELIAHMVTDFEGTGELIRYREWAAEQK